MKNMSNGKQRRAGSGPEVGAMGKEASSRASRDRASNRRRVRAQTVEAADQRDR